MITKAIQFVIPLTNRPGTMSKVTSALGKRGVNIIAILVPEAKEKQIARVMVKVDDLGVTRDALKRERIEFSEEDVLDIEMDNRLGAFGELSGKLAKAGINIKYAYATTAPFARARVVIGVPDVAKALAVLTDEPKLIEA
ncbi:MAG TPA: ACT domain-containing protein [Nitrososphaerales archaeon]|nr:ACT domain-containing protein [Nitrososphaerales archaeon]